MIKRSLLAAAALFAAATAVPHAGAAQSLTSPYEFVEGAHSFWAFGTAVYTDRGTLMTGPGSGYAYGAGYSYRLGGPFNIDIRVAYYPATRRVYNDTSEVADSVALANDVTFGLDQVGTADVGLFLGDASLRFDLTGPRTWHHLQPYALIGVGGVLSAPQDDEGEGLLPPDANLRVRFRDGFTGHVGAGVEVHVTEHWTLRLDARDLLWKLHLPGGFLQSERVVDVEQWVQTAHISVGLTFRF